MDDLFGVTELLQTKAADPEQGIVTADADKIAGSHVEHVNPSIANTQPANKV